MCLAMVGESLERGVDPRLVGGRGVGIGAEALQESAAEAVAREDTVYMAAHDAAISRDCTVEAVAEPQHGPAHAGAFRAADVHLVAGDGGGAAQLDTVDGRE